MVLPGPTAGQLHRARGGLAALLGLFGRGLVAVLNAAQYPLRSGERVSMFAVLSRADVVDDALLHFAPYPVSGYYLPVGVGPLAPPYLFLSNIHCLTLPKGCCA